MRYVNYIIANFPKDKQDEVYTVVRFLDNAKIKFDFTSSNIEPFSDEPADIWVKDINKKFQIVNADFLHHELLGKAKPDAMGVKFISPPPRQRKDVCREYIINPIQKKNKYGAAAKGIILLIRPPFDPPWVEQDINIQRKLGYNKILSKIGFDEIYMVCSNKNILIYP